jgi:hypothetical protein
MTLDSQNDQLNTCQWKKCLLLRGLGVRLGLSDEEAVLDDTVACSSFWT